MMFQLHFPFGPALIHEKHIHPKKVYSFVSPAPHFDPSKMVPRCINDGIQFAHIIGVQENFRFGDFGQKHLEPPLEIGNDNHHLFETWP